MNKLEARIDDCLVLQSNHVPVDMSQRNIVDKRAGIGPRQHETQLTNDAVKNLLGLLHELIGVDGKRLDIAMLHESTSVLTSVGLIEEAVRVGTIVTVFENCIP